MSGRQRIARTLYQQLLKLYPRAFRERFGVSMVQTFDDLCREQQQQHAQGLYGLVWGVLLETAIGIFREHLLLISSGSVMQTMLNTLGSSALFSLLLSLPFMLMEVVNRRNLNEDFPAMLFFGMWLNLFAISLILLPIVRSRRDQNHAMTNPVPLQSNTLATSPKSALLISVALILSVVILALVGSLGWAPLAALLNSSNPEPLSVFGVRVTGQLIALLLLSIPVAAGIMASGPITSTLRAGGTLFAHPFHLIIVVVILCLFTAGVVSLIVDQWPCFIGVPNCD